MLQGSTFAERGISDRGDRSGVAVCALDKFSARGKYAPRLAEALIKAVRYNPG